ncbi:MAG TPA: hypothetical protein VLG50_07375, partial [Candidatus Saccharimonadales bacterium]|nr:hypothetical protein [Candidatus Saccharimonadales bacterium]
QKVVGDYYTKNVSLCADINSSMHNKKYHGELVVIDKDCFYKYLGEEIDRLNGEIKTLIERLHGGL